MPNRDGNPQSLVPQRGNAHNAPHGAYSPRLREGRAREVADQVLAAPHTVPLDEYGALEIGQLIALIQALDVALTQRGVTASQGRVRDLVDVRLRASRRLAEWLDRYGMTPKGRAEWARQLAAGAWPLRLRGGAHSRTVAMPDDMRAVLEGIVYGDDPKISPADRLRAVEHWWDGRAATGRTRPCVGDGRYPEKGTATSRRVETPARSPSFSPGLVARMKSVSCSCVLLAGKFASRWKTRVAVPSSPVSSSAGMLNWLYGTAVT